MENLIAVFGKMRMNLTPDAPNEPTRLTVTKNGVDMELPYHSQVACVELEPMRVFNLSPVRGIVDFDSLRWPAGAELTSLEKGKVLKEVLDNVSRKAYECPVRFFIGPLEISLEEAYGHVNTMETSESNGGEDDDSKDESSVSELAKIGRPDSDAEQKEKPKRGRPRK